MKYLITKQKLLKKYLRIKRFLNEKTRRLWCASEAMAIGKHGVAMVSAVTQISPPTVYAGIRELKRKSNQKKSGQRIRKKGGGAKTTLSKLPKITKELESLAEPATKGDPMSPLLWVSKSLRNLSRELTKKNYPVSHTTVSSLLKEAGYSLQLNRKERDGKSVPDRNAQFEHINERIKTFLREGQPVISVDTKKKGNPAEVNMHDFPDKKEGKVAPYGVYDLGKNKGWVGVGIASDTAEFAVNTIRDWWHKMGKKDYKNASKLMITADCGGSNGSRVRLWKWELQRLANELRKEIHVCHFPPGTSKWNKIEHKMFSYITLNWRGVPLVSREAVVQLIGNTTTAKGLEIKSQIDYREYEKGKEVSDEDFKSIGMVPDKFHGEWNYRIEPMARINIGSL